MSQTDLTRAVITPANARGLKRVRQLGSQLDSVRWEKLCFDPSGARLLAKAASLLRWWNLDTATDVASGSVELKMEPIEALFHGSNHIVTAGPPVAEAAVAWRPRLMAFSTTDGSLWREETLSAPATGLAMSRDGMLLAILERGEALLWDVAGWKRIRDLPGVEWHVEVKACAFSRDSRFAAVIVTDYDHDQAALYLWDLKASSHPWVHPLGFQFAASVAFHPTRPLLVARGVHEVVVMDVHERRVLGTFNDYNHYVSNLDFSPGGDLMVSSTDTYGFMLHDFDTGEELFRHSDESEFPTGDAVFSPDGRFIALAQGDGTVGLWGVSPVA
ncbi:WD40 repeat domain-containing protein [Corallococcus exiguus]|uniref:WD40 repeat domain-containing protein n=1 Tax=Corallococcus exiguus TaxID=83462 RepID=UPI0015613D29|nr:WD40 repeat domain-containing protein [Corallococcus exiguus]NRD56380.1 WD40 repeat domain-containing protein [Corallococcus exiguus]